MLTPTRKLLLSIVELGGYPNFTPLYEELGYQVVVEKSVRKAIGRLKRTRPAVIVAEFNFQSDFRDRTSSLESLLAMVQRLHDTRVIVLYDREYAPQLDKLRARLPVHFALAFPVEARDLRICLAKAAVEQASGIDG
jgi:ActR/RegA family two-component response regulator